MRRDWCSRWCASLPTTKSSCTRSTRPRPTSPKRCSARTRGCSATSRSGTASRPDLRRWFVNFSTFAGRHGIYLEDLFVRPAFRGKGIGKALLVHLANECVANNWSQLQWAVLDWNTPSIDFYKSLGAVMMDEWTLCRVTGPALASLAKRLRHDRNRAHRRGRRQWRDRRRQCDSMAAEKRHAAPQGDDDEQARRDGPQDLRLAEARAAGAHQHRHHPRSPISAPQARS